MNVNDIILYTIDLWDLTDNKSVSSGVFYSQLAEEVITVSNYDFVNLKADHTYEPRISFDRDNTVYSTNNQDFSFVMSLEKV